MDAVDFLKVWQNICENASCCTGCPLLGSCAVWLLGTPKDMFGASKANYQHIKPEDIVKAVSDYVNKCDAQV